jgi:hypothetical protein
VQEKSEKSLKKVATRAASTPHPLTLLASRLASDEDADALSLSSSVSSATPQIRESTERLLLQASPKAARRLRQIVESGSDKDAIAAANVIFSKSPATPAQSLNLPSGASFSGEALEILFRGLASFARSANVEAFAQSANVEVTTSPSSAHFARQSDSTIIDAEIIKEQS